MQHVTLEKLQQNFEKFFAHVTDDHEPLAIAVDENRSEVTIIQCRYHYNKN